MDTSNNNNGTKKPIQSASHVENQVTGERTVPEPTKNKEQLKVKYFNSLINQQDFEFCENDKRKGDNLPIIVKGKLKANVRYWEDIGANKTILNVIRDGYMIPLVTTPERASFKNNKSALRNKNFVDEAICELLATGRIVETDKAPYVVNPLSVSTSSSGKQRLILDLRHVNKHVYKQSVRFDDWSTFSEFIEKQGFMFKFDIKQGYHHIDIAEEHQKFLGFSWEVGGIKKYFCFTVLPFGLTSAPFLFTKTIRVLIKYWRLNAIKIACFIDDGAGTSKNFLEAKRQANFVKKSLSLSGFIVNEEKSIWNPVQNMTWLGIQVDLQNKKFSIPEGRLQSFSRLLETVIQNLPYSTARMLARLCGKLISMKFVTGDIVRLKTRNLYFVVETRLSWDSRINLKTFSGALKELFFWKDNLNLYISKDLLTYNVPKLIVVSDASETGLASCLLNNGHLKVSYKNFSDCESDMNSTWRELHAIDFSIKSLSLFLGNRSVLWKTDNSACTYIVKTGSGKAELQSLAESIFENCKRENINLTVEWVPRESIHFVDALSKNVDYEVLLFEDNLIHFRIF